jgi:hypothetical protein
VSLSFVSFQSNTWDTITYLVSLTVQWPV